MFMKAHPDLDDALNRAAFDATLPLFARDPVALDAARYDRFAAFLKENGLLDAVPAIATYAIEPGGK